MDSIQIANVLIICVQSYIIYNFIYKIWKPRYGYIRSNLLTIVVVVGAYVNGNYIQIKAPTIVGVIGLAGMMILYAIFALEGTVFQNIKRGILYYIILGAIEAGSVLSLSFQFPFSFIQSMFKEETTTNTVIVRIIYTFVVYFFLMIIQLVINWKKSRDLKLLVIISTILVVFELFFIIIFYTVSENETRYIVMITAFSSILMLFGYYLNMEMFYEMIRQEKKKTKLEKERLEQKYQYDYYILAREYGEKARDLRHDMRNQLQTVQYLFQSEEDTKRAEEMVEKLKKRIEEVKN